MECVEVTLLTTVELQYSSTFVAALTAGVTSPTLKHCGQLFKDRVSGCRCSQERI